MLVADVLNPNYELLQSNRVLRSQPFELVHLDSAGTATLLVIESTDSNSGSHYHVCSSCVSRK